MGTKVRLRTCSHIASLFRSVMSGMAYTTDGFTHGAQADGIGLASANGIFT